MSPLPRNSRKHQMGQQTSYRQLNHLHPLWLNAYETLSLSCRKSRQQQYFPQHLVRVASSFCPPLLQIPIFQLDHIRHEEICRLPLQSNFLFAILSTADPCDLGASFHLRSIGPCFCKVSFHLGKVHSQLLIVESLSHRPSPLLPHLPAVGSSILSTHPILYVFLRWHAEHPQFSSSSPQYDPRRYAVPRHSHHRAPCSDIRSLLVQQPIFLIKCKDSK
mmetsp:Transcript_15576/g.24425  ORF Transcript_15576/g.24425 Transcript_15576/m.24425 type:complete len:219 (-) Transcript_15576:30-686(-)